MHSIYRCSAYKFLCIIYPSLKLLLYDIACCICAVYQHILVLWGAVSFLFYCINSLFSYSDLLLLLLALMLCT